MAGCEESFVTLYRRHQARIFRFALAMCGSEAHAEEVAQEVFMAVLKGDLKYDPSRGRLSALLIGVARNHVLRLLRRDSRYQGNSLPDQPAEAPDALSDLARRETIRNVRQAVLSLPEDYREVLVLCDLEEMDYAEAAEALGCPVGTIRSRLHRARGLLSGKLQSGPEASSSVRSMA